MTFPEQARLLDQVVAEKDAFLCACEALSKEYGAAFSVVATKGASLPAPDLAALVAGQINHTAFFDDPYGGAGLQTYL
jgi:hypothetical protein